MKRALKNLSYSFIANMLNMLVSVIVILLIPKFWGEEAYGYYQLYLFYVSYVGFFHLGWLDGIYLRIGGKEYSDLDGKLYSCQFWILTGVSVIVAIVLSAISNIYIEDINKQFVIYMTCICLVLFLARTFLVYIFQATNRIKEYAKVIISEKVVFILILAVFLLIHNREFKFLVYADLVGKAVSLIIAILYGRAIIFQKIKQVKNAIIEIYTNISVGCKLMMANIASMLIIGIVRLAIEANWDIVTFGKISLSLSVSNLLISFITAISVVVFPLLNRVNDEKKMDIYNMIKSLLMPCMFLVLVFYYPMQSILGKLLPVYRESLRYLAIMFPVCIFECKMAVLNNTYLKVFRKEKQILYINIITVGMSILMTGITVYLLKSLELAIGGIVLLVAFRNYLSEIVLKNSLKCFFFKDALWEIFLSVIFMLSSWYINGWLSMIIYGVCFVGYCLYYKNDVVNSIKMVEQ